ncbi:spore coat protein [Shimazuella alba]|uniref:Spore coat protein n=1 Tax=Shimazuella alba TaxID=2690964 RepID=A0A6I4VV44_9BACL|nr:spore coat protein [Shimazuella alba]MXQ54418.1 spore coat protein [Shimazuella alba]
MNEFFKSVLGMGDITDEVIASDLLISAKSGVRNYAFALTETATPEVRAALQLQFSAAMDLHEKVSNYMIENGYYHPQNMNEQLQLDSQNAQVALNASNLAD